MRSDPDELGECLNRVAEGLRIEIAAGDEGGAPSVVDGASLVNAPTKLTTGEQYCRLRGACGYDGRVAMIDAVRNGCDADAQENKLRQLRDGSKRGQDELDQFGGEHW